MLNPAPEPAQDIAALPPVPDSPISAEGLPLYGGFEGVVASASQRGLAAEHRLGGSDLRSIVNRRIREKSWVYVFAATSELSIAVALANGALTGTGFLMITDLRTGEELVNSSRKFALAAVNDSPGDGLRATYRLPGTRYSVQRHGDQVRVRVSLGRSLVSLPGRSRAWVDLDLTLEEQGIGLSAIAQIEHSKGTGVSVTSKTACLPTSGSLTVRDEGGELQTVSLDGGFGGYDYTKGLLPRNSYWRWGFATGRLADGTVLGLNLVENFSGLGDRVQENAVWIDGRPLPVDPRARFEFDRDDVMKPWTLRTVDGAVRLRFQPLAAHDERIDLKVLRSLFIQPMGYFSGEIHVDGRTYVLDRLPGVVEDQDIVW